MTHAEAQRRSTIPLSYYGGSSYYFDFVLADESLRFRGNEVYGVMWDKEVLTSFEALSAHQSWAETRHDLIRAEELLLARGWKRDKDMRSMTKLPESASDARSAINYDTSIDRAFYYKGPLMIELSACGYGRDFWRTVGVYRREDFGPHSSLRNGPTMGPVKTSSPVILLLGTVPQYRESFDLSRLSPSTKY